MTLALAMFLAGCGLIKESSLRNDDAKLWSFGQELSFFSKYGVQTVLLEEGDSIIAVSPEWQARVMTSTFDGVEGGSLGWINRELIVSARKDAASAPLSTEQIGGEDRFWIGPEGGDLSIFFDDPSKMTVEHWRAPKALSSEPWNFVGKNKTQAKFEKEAEFRNVKGKSIRVKAEREISLINKTQASEILGIEIPESVKLVAFQSFNKLTNTGNVPWSPDNGMANISVQSCFNANRKVKVFMPYRQGDSSKLGNIVRDNFYQPTLSGDSRLLIESEYIRFIADGRNLSGIGVPPKRSEGIIISFDAENVILTVILYIKPSGDRSYLSSGWRRGASTFDGDAISLFNNGPLSTTSAPANPYYEVSTYSPALALESGKSQFHIQRVFHFGGSEYDLGLIAYKLTGISIGQLRGTAE